MWRRAGDSWFELLPPTNAAAVCPGASPNQLTARVIGAQLELLVNEVEVASVSDPSLSQGGAGVFVQGENNALEFQDFLVQPL